MKVLHVIRQLSSGGGCVCAFEFAAACNRIDPSHRHEILTLERVSRRLYRPPEGVPFYFPAGRGMRELAKRVAGRAYDVVHVHWWHRDPLMRDFMNEATTALRNVRRVLTCDVYPGADAYRMEQADIEFAEAIAFDGIAALEAYPEVSSNKKYFIVGGGDLRPYRRARRKRSSADGAFRFIRGSTLNPEKTPINLIDLVKPALAGIPGSEFHIFGRGELELSLRSQIARAGLQSRVFLRGWSADFPAEVANADAYLYHLPRASYASSELNLQGAMAAGIPVVAMPSLGVRWMFRDGEDSLVGENPAACAAAAIRLASDARLRARLGEGARRRSERDFGAENMAKEYINKIYGTEPRKPSFSGAWLARRAAWRFATRFYLPIPQF